MAVDLAPRSDDTIVHHIQSAILLIGGLDLSSRSKSKINALIS
jgi:hypothetical protein